MIKEVIIFVVSVSLVYGAITGIKSIVSKNEKYRRESIKWRDWRYDRRHVRRAINSYDN